MNIKTNEIQNEVKLNDAEKFDYNDTFAKKTLSLWKRYKKNKLAVIGLVVLMFMYICVIFAPLLATYDPAGTTDDILYIDMAPSFHSYEASNLRGEKITYKPNYFGRDELGRDVLSRCLYAGRISLTIGFVSVGISTFIGTIWGCIAGYFGGWIDNVMMRVVDAILSIPIFILLVTIMSLFKGNIITVMVVLGLTGWASIARYVRAEFLSLMKRDFVTAAIGIGAKDIRIIFRHVLPNAIGPIIVSSTMGVAGAILSESSLSFFGLGVQPPMPSWGNMLMSAQNINTMMTAPWKAIYPGALIFVTVLSFNFVGDGLRDALDPKLK